MRLSGSVGLVRRWCCRRRQVLAGGNRQALAVALAARLQFVRAEGFVFSHVADEGWMDACAGPLLRYRRSIGADGVSVWCDVKKKHRWVSWVWRIDEASGL